MSRSRHPVRAKFLLTSVTWGREYPKVQLATVAELLAGRNIEMPPIRQVDATFKKAPKVTKQQGEQLELQV